MRKVDVKVKGLEPIRDRNPQDKVRRLIQDIKEKGGERTPVKDFLYKEMKV